MEYETTIGEYSITGKPIGSSERHDAYAENLTPPDGEYWKLVAVAAAARSPLLDLKSRGVKFQKSQV